MCYEICLLNCFGRNLFTWLFCCLLARTFNSAALGFAHSNMFLMGIFLSNTSVANFIFFTMFIGFWPLNIFYLNFCTVLGWLTNFGPLRAFILTAAHFLEGSLDGKCSKNCVGPSGKKIAWVNLTNLSYLRLSSFVVGDISNLIMFCVL